MADGHLCCPTSSGLQECKPISSYADILKGNKQIDISHVEPSSSQIDISNVQPSSSLPNSTSQASTSAQIECNEAELAELKHPVLIQGTPAILFNLSEQTTLSSKFRYTLVGKFSHGKPSWKKVMDFFDRIKLSSPCKVSIYDHKHLYIVCTNKSDFNRLWLKLVWLVDGYAMRVFKWDPSFNALRESSIAPVWIRMEGLPLYMFDKMPLLNIANVIGKPICIDRRNLNGTMLNTAKVCIELDVSKPLVETIKLGIEQNESKTIVEECLVHVFYDVVPPFCQLCWHLGHGQDKCKRSNISPVVADSNGGPIHRPGKEVIASSSQAATQMRNKADHHKINQVWQPVGCRQNAGAAAKSGKQHDGLLNAAAAGEGSQIVAEELSGNQHVAAAGKGSQNEEGELIYSASSVHTVNEATIDSLPVSTGSAILEAANEVLYHQPIIAAEQNGHYVKESTGAGCNKSDINVQQNLELELPCQELHFNNILPQNEKSNLHQSSEAMAVGAGIHQDDQDQTGAAMTKPIADQEDGWSTVKRKKKKSVAPAIHRPSKAKAVHPQKSDLQALHPQQHLPPSHTNSRVEEVIVHMYTKRVDAAIENAIHEDFLDSFATPPTSQQPPSSTIVAAPTSNVTKFSNYIATCNRRARNRFRVRSDGEYEGYDDSSDWTEAHSEDFELSEDEQEEVPYYPSLPFRDEYDFGVDPSPRFSNRRFR